MKNLSVIIVNHEGEEILNRCLESLKIMELSRFSYEVIVVDSKSNKASHAGYTLQYPEFSFFLNTGNNSFANGCNLGAAKSKGSVLLFLNPGTSVTLDVLNDMLDDVRVGPKYSIISYRKVHEDGPNGLPGKSYLVLSKLNEWLQMIRQIFYSNSDRSIAQSNHCAYPDWIFGSAFMINRDGFFQMGKWDEDFWMYFEDDDLYNKEKSDYSEIVKLKNGTVGHNYRRPSKIVSKSRAIIKSEIHRVQSFRISQPEIVYESPSWF
ncbi:MAG: glycosyltransferase [Prolixibacteraceae bacterium]